MKKKSFFMLLLIPALLIIMYFVLSPTSWENTKLNLTKFWGLTTLDNNPLLKNFDKDFKTVNIHDIENSRIDEGDLLSGGPGKDGIPSIDDPAFTSYDETKFEDEELVVGVYLNGEARAYPYGILNWHEIINDQIGKTPITITLCPLCDTNPVFIRKVEGKETTFGVSGKLYQSCLVMYDRLTDTLWAQPWGMGILGKNVNESLEKVPAQKTTLGQWVSKHSKTKVLSENTGFSRDYFAYPYGSYYTDDNLIFPVRNQNEKSIHPKEITSYIWEADDETPKNQFSGDSFHITHKEARQLGRKELLFNDQNITLEWDENLKTVVFYKKNKEIPSSTAFGFVYSAFFK